MAKQGKVNRKRHVQADEIVRPTRIRTYKYLFLIICEDQKTEKAYFEQFKPFFPEGVFYLEVHGTGFDQRGIVEKAEIEKSNLNSHFRREVDETWLVFDVDDASRVEGKGKNFITALQLAKKSKMKVAYSNEVFELWLLLHFKDIDSQTPLPRADIYTQFEPCIRQYWGYENFTYNHGKIDIITVVAEVGDEALAIERAKRLEEAQKGREPLEANPVTYVHKLVSEIRERITYFNYKP